MSAGRNQGCLWQILTAPKKKLLLLWEFCWTSYICYMPFCSYITILGRQIMVCLHLVLTLHSVYWVWSRMVGVIVYEVSENSMELFSFSHWNQFVYHEMGQADCALCSGLSSS